MENSTTSNNFVLFQTWEVKKTKLTENSSCSNEILPEDRFKNLQLNSVAKSEMSVEYEIKEQKWKLILYFHISDDKFFFIILII